MRRTTKLGIAAFITTAVSLIPSAAYGAEPGTYANWALSGSNGNWTAKGTPAAGFPMASMASNATSVSSPSGASAFMGPGTPIGAAYGSSQNMNYLNISTAAGITESTSTWTFDSPTPAGKWAFAVGDVDADRVQISATDENGDPVPVAQLGFQSTFNYCASSPKPGSCAGPGPFTDVPTWNPGTSRLTGNTLDTMGASAWFEPTAAIKTLTFKFTAIVGFPVFQLWLATKSVPVVVPVGGVTPECPATVELDEPDGTPILDANGNPVTAETGANGEAVIDGVADGSYNLHLTTGSCGEITGPTDFPIIVKTEEGPVNIPAGTFTVFVPTLPATGTSIGAYVQTGAAMLGTGAILFWVGTRRRRLS